MMQTVESGYAPVNGLELYYEIRGSGEPLVLLHGGVAGSVMFSALAPLFAENRKVITVDLQAHGRTHDIDRPFRYELMADDVAALMAHLGLAQADFMGYSLGAQTATQIAIRHPELIRKLILVSVTFARAGSYPEVIAAFDQMGPEAGQFMPHSPLAQIYPNVNWAVLFGKLGEMLRLDYDWSQEVAKISAPTLLIYADADSIRTTHMMEFYALLGGGQRDGGLDGSGRSVNQFAILPAATHYDILNNEALPGMVQRYLDAP